MRLNRQLQDSAVNTILDKDPTNDVHNLRLLVHHRKLFEKNFSCAEAKFYNMLSQVVKSENPRTLKLHLTMWLLENPFYSVDDFF
ncbi:hypothetical protein J6590_069245 [Homalodisca vitripennis]|nr:hypothetical protein J6590_069245 [Homalodisca vitripennis]